MIADEPIVDSGANAEVEYIAPSALNRPTDLFYILNAQALLQANIQNASAASYRNSLVSSSVTLDRGHVSPAPSGCDAGKIAMPSLRNPRVERK